MIACTFIVVSITFFLIFSLKNKKKYSNHKYLERARKLMKVRFQPFIVHYFIFITGYFKIKRCEHIHILLIVAFFAWIHVHFLAYVNINASDRWFMAIEFVLRVAWKKRFKLVQSCGISGTRTRNTYSKKQKETVFESLKWLISYSLNRKR